MRRKRGVSLIETVVAIALLAIIVVSILSAFSAITIAAARHKQQTTLDLLTRSDAEYIKSQAYSPGVPGPTLYSNLTAAGYSFSYQVTYWDPKEVKPHTTRKFAFAFGQGIAPSPDGDGLVAVDFSGSFEPGKLFTIAARVQDPAHGQTLTLELPAGMERIEGQLRQPVPAVDEDGNTMVLWKARVLETGRFPVRVHSSTGTTQTKIVTISRS